MHEITKIFKFDAAHRLSKHEGKCKNLHGHTWTVEITVGSHVLNKNDMVLDFAELKKTAMHIIDQLDHSLLVHNEDRDLINLAEKLEFRWKAFKADPTSEIIAEAIYAGMEGSLPRPIEVISIKVWESPDSFSTYRG